MQAHLPGTYTGRIFAVNFNDVHEGVRHCELQRT
jgi:hypothetical protein